MSDDQLEAALKSIGKRSFVEDYAVYSDVNLSRNDKIDILARKYSAKTGRSYPSSENGAKIRVSFAEEVFRHGMQKQALQLIEVSTRVDAVVRQKARLLRQQLD